MAEIGLIASVIGVAGAGIKLSITLYTFSETVATAADSIKSIAKDVSLTSAVLEELGSNLRQDEQARLYSGTALRTAQTVVVDCEAVFKQIDGALSKSMERIGGLASTGKPKGKGGKVVLSAIERLKWPFLQPKMQELRANLERLKSTLVLMLNVLTYARKVHTEKQSQPPKDDYQRLLIENLVAANQEATRNFQTLLRTIGSSDETGSIMTTSTRELSIGESTLVAERAPSDEKRTSSNVAEEADFKQQKASETSLAHKPHDVPAPEEDSGITQFTVSGTSSATETTMACLKRIQEALDQFEASEDKIASATQMKVSIEVCKHILHSGAGPRVRRPWEVASIVRHQDDKALELDDSNEFPLPGSTRLEAGVPSRPKGDESYRSYAPAIASPNTTSGQLRSSRRTAALQDQIGDTIAVMRENLDKVVQRGERIDSLQDKTESLSVSAEKFRTAANRAQKQQGWLSTLSTAWKYLPSPRAAIASADEFLQEKFAAVFYTGGKPEDNITSTGDNTVLTPGSPRPGAVDYFAISDAHGDKIVAANAIMSIGGQVATDDLISSGDRGATDDLISVGDQGATNDLTSFSDITPIGDEMSPTKQVRSEDETVAANEFSTPLSSPRSSSTLVAPGEEPSGKAAEARAQLQGIESIGGTQDPSLEFLLKEWTTLYD